MRMVIIGAGAMGMLWATKCAPYVDVTLVTHSYIQSELINETGILSRDVDGSTKNVNITAIDITDINSYLSKDYAGITWVVLAVKQTQLESVVMTLKQIASHHYHFLALQNGMGHVELLSQHFDREQIAYGVTTMGARRVSETEFHQTGTGDTYVGPASNELRLLAKTIHTGIALEVVNDIEARQWEKLLINAIINPLTSILEITNGELGDIIDSAEYRPMVMTLIREAVTVAATQGHEIEIEGLFQKIMTVTRKTNLNRSSMLQDVIKGNETEIDFINGYITRTGKKTAIETPLHDMLTFFIRTKTKSRMKLI